MFKRLICCLQINEMYQPNGVSSSNLVHSNAIAMQPLESGPSTMDPISGGNNLNNNPNLASKQRLRWTNELHERFVDAVAQLGGPDREFLEFLFVVSHIGFSNSLLDTWC